MIGENAKKAIKLGALCSIAYLAVYVARNLLGVVAPQMIENGPYTIEYIGSISTGFMLCYAAGQLVNGAVGDKIKSKYMISTGLIMAGVCNFLLPYSASLVLTTVLYGLSGFFLSMIYGPMTRTVSESVLPKYASRCALGYTIASFLGSPGAGVIAMMFRWKMAFAVTAAINIIMGIVAFVSFSIYEKKNIISYGEKKEKESNKKGIKLLLENEIIKYTFVSVVTGVIRTSVVFWIPTYLNKRLGFSSVDSAGLFSLLTVIMSMAPYVNNLVMYEMVFKRNKDRTLLFMFSLSAVSFLMMFIFKNPVINLVFLSLALTSNGGSSTVLWSAYCPSLVKTGMVSTATGYLDCVSYVSAASANVLFSNAATQIGWDALVLVWFAIAAVGVVVALPLKKKINE